MFKKIESLHFFPPLRGDTPITFESLCFSHCKRAKPRLKFMLRHLLGYQIYDHTLLLNQIKLIFVEK